MQKIFLVHIYISLKKLRPFGIIESLAVVALQFVMKKEFTILPFSTEK